MVGAEIVRAVGERYGIDLFAHRDTKKHGCRALARARREACLELYAAKFSATQIRKLLGISHATTTYHIYPRQRENMRRNHAAIKQRKVAKPSEPDRTDEFLRYFPPDLQRWLAQRARVEGVSPVTLVRERVREIAEHGRFVEERTA